MPRGIAERKISSGKKTPSPLFLSAAAPATNAPDVRMKRIPLLLATAALGVLSLHAENFICAHGHVHAAPAAGSGSGIRRYAPDRRADLLHLVIDVTPDFKQRSISGQATITFKPIGQPLDELRLNGIDLQVSSVVSSSKLKGYQSTADEVVLTFEKPLPPGVEQKVTIVYTATPGEGLYFRTPEQGYKKGETHLYSQGETIFARHWFPVLDSPNEKLTTEVICHVPDGMSVFANGKLMSQEKSAATGLTAFRWKQEKPHSAYLVSLVAGQFAVVEDKYKDLPLAFIVPPGDAALARKSLDGTKEMLAFFEKELGYPYAWEKYYQIVVRDFQWGGMENTSVTTLTDRTLHTAEYETLRSSIGLVAHELAHQWFGDVVTCKDWSTLWLNEGFATYYDALFQEHFHGREHFLYERWQVARGLTGTQEPRPIVYRKTAADALDQFSNLSYQKGSWVLHMLRSDLGPDLYRQAIQTYLKRHQFQPVVTENLLSVFEETTGKSFDQFFDQWVFHGGHPELAVDYSWDDKTGLARVGIRQTQKTSDEILQFRVPVTVRFKGDFGTVDKVFQLEDLAQDFHVALPSAPKVIRVDPDIALLAKVEFTPSRALLDAQLADAADPMGRILAIEKIAKDKQADAVKRIQGVVKNDRLWFVRLEAAKALRQLGTDEALTVLRGAVDQPDARVRQAVVDAIGSFTQPEALETLLAVLPKEKNPDIRDTILRSLPRHPKPETRAELLRQLESKSLRDHLFDAAVAGLRSADDASLIMPLQEALLKRGTGLEGRSLGQALTALGFLARNETDKTPVRDLLLKHASDLRDPVARGAISGLGQLVDLRARPVLAGLAVAAPNEARRKAAETALKALDQGVKGPEAVTGLRTEVLELQKSNKDLKAEMETLKKRFDAVATRPAGADAKKKKK